MNGFFIRQLIEFIGRFIPDGYKTYYTSVVAIIVGIAMLVTAGLTTDSATGMFGLVLVFEGALHLFKRHSDDKLEAKLDNVLGKI